MHDVIIIGAGVSGLATAWRLETAGLDVCVVEARARVGGRTWSSRLAGANFDLGATWVWDSEVSVHSLLRELGIGTFLLDDVGDDLYDSGGKVQRIQGPRSSVPERRVHGGTEAIAKGLERKVRNLTLDCAARAIEPAEGGVRIVFDDGDKLARHVVVALPPALLGSEIALRGVDDDVVDMLRQTPTWMSDVAKVVAVFPSRFWRDEGLSGRAFSPVGPMAEVHDISGPTKEDGAGLFGFVPRANAQRGDWQEKARAQLTHLFGASASDPIAFHAHAWWSEPETSPREPIAEHPGLFGHARLRRPLMGGRVHLSSTETSAISTGHIEGAVRRGEEVARAILDEMR